MFVQIILSRNWPKRVVLSLVHTAARVNILFTDGGGKLLLTQAVSPRYSIQDDGV